MTLSRCAVCDTPSVVIHRETDDDTGDTLEYDEECPRGHVRLSVYYGHCHEQIGPFSWQWILPDVADAEGAEAVRYVKEGYHKEGSPNVEDLEVMPDGDRELVVFADMVDEQGFPLLAAMLRRRAREIQDSKGTRSPQPVWRMVANLGDSDPFTYGGYFVYEDRTGRYEAEAAFLEPDQTDETPDGGEWPATYTVYRFILDKCTYINGVLSDNKFHPEQSAWFAHTENEKRRRPQDTTCLSNVASHCGLAEEELIRMFCSDDPAERAHAYREVANFHGWENLDNYPIPLTALQAGQQYAWEYQELRRRRKRAESDSKRSGGDVDQRD